MKKFKPGMKLICINGVEYEGLIKGKIYTFKEYANSGDVLLEETSLGYVAERFIIAKKYTCKLGKLIYEYKKD